ncbi:MAG: GspE/PulE family protein [Gallionella sp.]|nr:GspE/PulE family protein [Gallionella sp.]
MAQRPIGELLKEAGIVTEEMIEYALTIKRVSRERLGDILLRLRFATDAEVARVLASQTGLTYEALDTFKPEPDALAQIPFNAAQKLALLPVRVEDGKLIVATHDPFNSEIESRVGRFTSYPMQLVVAPAARLNRLIQRAYYIAEHPIDEEIERLSGAIMSGREFNAERMLDLLLSSAIDLRASDMHISPTPTATLVSYRVDGVLQLRYALPPSAHGRVISTCKVRAGLDIADATRSQDGRMSFAFLDGSYDIRVSTMPSSTGENLVVRILSGGGELISLQEIGFSDAQMEALNHMTSRAHGTILVTGPTGSGKTTSLYGMLRRINAMEKNVLTIEDPVEYMMPLMHQVEVNEKAGITFGSSIRSFLRQDPDVILVGEIRDEETASQAMRAAQTGHLVFSSLHTNDALGAVMRLRDLGIVDYVLSSSLVGIVAQRLLRRLCPHCKKPATGSGEWQDIPLTSLYEHVGCEHCRDTGYSGRQAVAEVLLVDDELRRMIDSGASPYELERATRARGQVSLNDSGRELVQSGITDIAEFNRVLA